ncbi:MAG: protein-L-isoaspartate(D-aspartate) O-methyltransferase [Candidatus Thermoplasmatota archaeon]|nr:protein-L-isoaspartate(D-aspartate) O-methyltransferase [Candidatus Thermoplasmatota archaeon]
MGNDDLVKGLIRSGLIRSDAVKMAFSSVDRRYFVPPEQKKDAYLDTPLPTMDGQTISAPHMVAIMAEELRVESGMKVLEIGTGSGYHAAIVSRIVGPEGRVVSVERVPSLVEWGRANLRRAGIENVMVIKGDGSKGYHLEAPYDRIYYTAGSPDVPETVRGQLNEDGIILGVVGPARGTQRLVRYTKKGGRWEERTLTYCVFVPLIGELGY